MAWVTCDLVGIAFHPTSCADAIHSVYLPHDSKMTSILLEAGSEGPDFKLKEEEKKQDIGRMLRIIECQRTGKIDSG
jgi:hypothetical protein